jgi:hypothetical protein
MADQVFVPDPISWKKEFKSWNGLVGRHMKKVMTKQVLLSKVSSPSPITRPRNRTGINYSTGVLQSSIIGLQTKWNTELEAQVHAMAKHAMFVHEGTKPHPITPKKPGGVLRFYWHRIGRTIVVKEIKKHPGTRPIPFLRENLASAVR